MPRERDKIAPAVERPTPGSAATSSKVCGNSPPCRLPPAAPPYVNYARGRNSPAGPQMQHFIQRRLARSITVGKRAIKVCTGNNRGDLRLLQHHLESHTCKAFYPFAMAGFYARICRTSPAPGLKIALARKVSGIPGIAISGWQIAAWRATGCKPLHPSGNFG